MEQGESIPQFIRDFSIKKSPEKYGQTVQAIKDKRQEFHQQRRDRQEKQTKLQTSTTERQETLDTTLNKLYELRDHIDELSTSKFKKLISYFRLRKIRADIEIGEKSYKELKQQQDSETVRQQMVIEDLKTPPELQDAKNILNDFYQNQKEEWANSNYSKEDIKKYFTEEHLSSLSLENYILLLKRFPSHMVTHVTRQGVRDHLGMPMNHDTGENQHHNGFINIVKDGRLRSPLGARLIEKEKEKAIAKYLELDNYKNQEEALKRLSTIINPSEPKGSYADRNAIHFAAEEVADANYGAETGNEIFIAYPSALIASEYYFIGKLNNNSGRDWNDQWVWTSEEHGININAGLVFIPAEAQVDKNTGSRYQLDGDKNPIKNTEYYSALQNVINSPTFNSFSEQITEINKPLWMPKIERELLRERELQPFRQKLEQEFDIKDKRLQDAIFNYSTKGVIDKTDEDIKKCLIAEGILFTEAQNTVSSQDFWENYFNQNPDKRPSKIIYYKGQDPSQALQQWKKENGLIKTSLEKHLDFEEHNTSDNPSATAGIDRFRSLAEKVIQDYYKQKEKVTA